MAAKALMSCGISITSFPSNLSSSKSKFATVVSLRSTTVNASSCFSMLARWMPGQPQPPNPGNLAPRVGSKVLEQTLEHESKDGNEKPTNIGATRELVVNITNAVIVSPARETSGGLYVLSNLDQTYPHMIEIVFAFKGEGRGSCSTTTETIRASLAEVLVDFYPFAGRLVMGSDGKMAATCTGEGVLFVEAMSDDEIRMLGDISVVNPGTLRKLVKHSDGAKTIVEESLLTVQVTTLKCGGITVGIVMNHVLVDGKALADFLTCWSDVARGRSPSILPFLNRSVLCPRRPPRVELPHHEYAPIDRPSEKIVDCRTKPHVYRSFYFEPHTLIQLKKVSTITTHDDSSIVPTSFEVISALVWIARTKALGMDPHETAKLLTAVDGRPKFDPPLPSGYFGNGIAWSFAECSAGELTCKPFLFAVQTVQEALRCVTESYIRSAIDHVELNRVVVDYENACCISKWSRLSFYETDFGFGRPFQVAPTMVPHNLVLVASQSEESDNLVVSLGLPRDAMDVFSKLIQSELALMNKY